MIISAQKTIVLLFSFSFFLMGIDSFPYFPTSSVYRPIAFFPLIAAFGIYITKVRVKPFLIYAMFFSFLAIYHSLVMAVALNFPLAHISKTVITVILFFIMLNVFNEVLYIKRFDIDSFYNLLGKMSFYALLLMFSVGFIQLFFPSSISSVITSIFSYRSVNRLQMVSGEPSQMVRHLLFYLLFFYFFYHGNKRKLMLAIGGVFLLASGSTYGYITILIAIATYIILFKPSLIFSLKKILSMLVVASLLYYLYLNFLDDYTLNKINGIADILISKQGVVTGFSFFIERDGSAFQRIINPVIGFMSGESSSYFGVGLGAYYHVYPNYIFEYFPYAVKFDMVANVINGTLYITPKSIYSKIYSEMGALIFIIFVGYLCRLYYGIKCLKKHRHYKFFCFAFVLMLVLVIQGDSIIFLNYFFLLTLIHSFVFKREGKT